jgi:glycerol-3-phosphate dehydrogenase
VPYTGDPAAVQASADEEQYLLDLAQQFFKTKLDRSAIVWRYAGVRPLYDDASDNPSAVTRDYHLELDPTPGAPPRLSVYGGKVTTYRRLAEEVLERLAPHLDPHMGAHLGHRIGPAWTAEAKLPGGDIHPREFEAFVASLIKRFPSFEPLHLKRLARRHGSLVFDVLGDARSPAGMGAHLYGGLTEREVAYMKAQEWARTADDILWRRTKLGLHALVDLDAAERQALSDRIAALL